MLVKDLIQEYSVRNKEKKDYPVYSVTNSQGFCKDYFGKEVASKDKSTYKIVPYGCFAYNPSRINVGSIDWQHCEDFVIVSPLYNVFTVNTNITRQDYLSYYFKSHLVSDYINTFAKGSVRLNVPLSTLGNFPVPVPPLAEQERIVAELDLLSSIIDKKKAQLKELDQLAQSIFYTMFGDPITNEKGWEVKKLGEACKLMAGGDVPRERFSKEKTKTYSVPVFSNGIENCGLYGYTDIPKITEKSITISGRGTIGFVAKRKEPFYPIIRLIVVTPINDIDITYLEYYAISMHFDGNGVAIPQLTVPMIKNVPIPLPPLPLQQEFASKIEAIERQKSLIQQSIVETQTLFDSRMDHWFG